MVPHLQDLHIPDLSTQIRLGGDPGIPCEERLEGTIAKQQDVRVLIQVEPPLGPGGIGMQRHDLDAIDAERVAPPEGMPLGPAHRDPRQKPAIAWIIDGLGGLEEARDLESVQQRCHPAVVIEVGVTQDQRIEPTDPATRQEWRDNTPSRVAAFARGTGIDGDPVSVRRGDHARVPLPHVEKGDRESFGPCPKPIGPKVGACADPAHGAECGDEAGARDHCGRPPTDAPRRDQQCHTPRQRTAPPGLDREVPERDRRAEGGETIEEREQGASPRRQRLSARAPQRREEDARDHRGDGERSQGDADEVEQEPRQRDAADRTGGQWCGGESRPGGTAQGTDRHPRPDPAVAPAYRHGGTGERADREPRPEVRDRPGIEEEDEERRGGQERIPPHHALAQAGDAHQERERGRARRGRGPAQPGDVGHPDEGGEDPRRLPSHPGQPEDRQHPSDDEADVEARDRQEMDQPARGEPVTGVAVDRPVAVEEKGVDEGRLVAVEAGGRREEGGPDRVRSAECEVRGGGRNDQGPSRAIEDPVRPWIPSPADAHRDPDVHLPCGQSPSHHDRATAPDHRRLHSAIRDRRRIDRHDRERDRPLRE